MLTCDDEGRIRPDGGVSEAVEVGEAQRRGYLVVGRGITRVVRRRERGGRHDAGQRNKFDQTGERMGGRVGRGVRCSSGWESRAGNPQRPGQGVEEKLRCTRAGRDRTG